MENNNIQYEIYSLIIFIISGIFIGLFFDIFRILRKTFKTSDIITYIEDIVFWIITGIFLLFVIFIFQNGEIRSYSIIGIITGVIIYMLTISKYFIKINVYVLKFIKKIFLYPLKLFFKPILIIVFNIRNIIIQKNTKNIKKNKNLPD